jgi:hypothetical protein
MKTDMRRELAREPFEEKIRKVGQLIELSVAVKSSRVREETQMKQNPLGTRANKGEASAESKP